MRGQFRRIGATLLLAAAAAAAVPGTARAQTLPQGPLVADLGGAGRLVAGGEVSLVAGRHDPDAFFNYTGYEHNALRLVRIALAARWQPMERAALLADVRSENLETPRLYALYARVRPFAGVPFDVQAGRIPPVFGRFARQAYAADNPLIGYPLAYQYLTSLRADAVPAASEDLVRMRGRGWLASYPIGNGQPGPGVPLVSAFRYDTGVQARYAPGAFEIAAAVTRGSLAEPGGSDEGLQVAARAAVAPVAGLVAGLSASRGGWLHDVVIPQGDDRSYPQRAIGADVEYSRDHWLVRGELIASQWRLPYLGTPVTARSGFVEARWRVRPRWFIAGRADRLTFSTLRAGGVDTAWDAPVTRVEAGGGWYFQRNLVAKIVAQHNWRDGGRIRQRTFVAGQLLFWF